MSARLETAEQTASSSSLELQQTIIGKPGRRPATTKCNSSTNVSCHKFYYFHHSIVIKLKYFQLNWLSPPYRPFWTGVCRRRHRSDVVDCQDNKLGFCLLLLFFFKAIIKKYIKKLKIIVVAITWNVKETDMEDREIRLHRSPWYATISDSTFTPRFCRRSSFGRMLCHATPFCFSPVRTAV